VRHLVEGPRSFFLHYICPEQLVISHFSDIIKLISLWRSPFLSIDYKVA